MKKLFFTSMLAFLMANISFAQIANSQRIEPDLPAHVAQVLKRAQQVLTPKTQGPTLRTEPLRLDSSIRFIAYDLATKDSTPVVRTRNQYPNPSVTVEYQDQLEEGQWQTLSRFTQTRDQLGRVIELSGESYDAGQYILESKLLLYPRGNSMEMLDSVVIYAWNPDIEQLEKALKQNNVYNEKNQLIRTWSEVVVSGFKVELLENYTYNAAGENTLIEDFKIYFGIMAPSTRTEMKYKDGKLQEHVLSLYVQGKFIPSDRELFSYYSGGFRQEVFIWDEANANWYKIQNLIHRIDAWNRIVWREKLSRGSEGGPDERQLELYTYLTEGTGANAADLKREELFHWDTAQSKFNLSDRKYYYYRGISTRVPDLEVDAKTLRVYPNPSTDKVYLSMEQDAQVQVYNTAGQVMFSQQVLSGQALDIHMLPKGVYYFLARQEQNLYSGKMIKL